MCLSGETCPGYSLTSAIGFVLLEVNHASTLPSPREQHKSPTLSGLVFRHRTGQEDLGVRTQSWVWILIHFLPSGIKQVLLPFKVHFLACELKIAVATSWKECQGQKSHVDSSLLSCRPSPHTAAMTNRRSARHTLEISCPDLLPPIS